MIHIADSTLIGDLGFIDKPDQTGTVEMGYEVLSADRQQGFAFEAAKALVYICLYSARTQENYRSISRQSCCLDSHSEKIRNATNW
ncbi:GNAT family N-acetyltransferase [Nostoc sp.]|uniref:GNAT family N-acetyltransferase n=1 Tax=Nostoc sp. TaxID=1180 RepID=UPI002FF59EE1